MRITDLEVDRFGLWEGLKLESLSDELTVFYGPNETGKTTLMQFVRGVLYGFTPERRSKYLHAFKSGRAGGTVHVADNAERLALARLATPADEAGEISVSDHVGTKLNDRRLTDLLGGVDETTFINVFACGLREIQELGTLSDTEAATLLYDLTMGTDRVSLSAATREVDSERNRLLSGDVRHSAIAQLLADRDAVQKEIDALGELTPKYLQLCARRAQVDREVEQHRGTEHIDREIRHVELAKAVAEPWKSRAELDRRLAEYGPNDGAAAELLVKIDELDAKIKEGKRRRKILFRKRRKLRLESKGIQVNDALCQQASKLDALGEQQSWMGSLWAQLKKLEDEVAELELAAEAPRTLWVQPVDKSQDKAVAAAAAKPQAVAPPQLSDRAMTDLRVAAKSLSDARRRFRALQGDLGLPAGGGDSVDRRIQAVLGGRGEGGLHEAVGEAGEIVSLIRRRVQLEEKLEQMIRREKELNAQSTEWFERQQLPTWQVATLGGFFILGAALIFLYMAGWVLPATVTGKLGWPLALLGIASTTFAGLGKMALEQSAASELEQCRRQLDALNEQFDKSREERKTIDERLPKSNAPLAIQLRDAEKDLAELEALLPLESQREAAAHLSRDYQRRRKQTKVDALSARKRWKNALAAAGWPSTVSPRQFHEYRKRHLQAKEALAALRVKRDEHASRQRDYRSVADRIFQVAADVGLAGNVNGDAAAKLKELQSSLGEHAQRRDRRAGLRRQSTELGRRQSRYERAVTALLRKREHMLLNSGFANEEEARQRALRFAEVQQLERQRAGIAQQIALMLGIQATEEMVGKYLDGRDLDHTHAELTSSLASIRASLQAKLEQRAELTQQMRVLADDKRPSEKRLELASIERRIEQQTERWRALAVTGSLLNSVQASYERNRQPVALREATEFMARMTGGKYTRVWTPLGEPELRVDEVGGKSLPVEVLSAGTREQLFLSLRLALVKLYAERGIKLPVVLDDVLVNFDTVRAKAAAAVLRDFARGGHQLLVFTCHEHIARMFKALNVDVRELPVGGRVPNVLADEPEEIPPPKERKRKEPKPEPIEPTVEVLPPLPAPLPLAPIEVRFQRIEYDPVSYVPLAPPPPRAKRVRIDRPERVEPVEVVAKPAPPPKPLRKPQRKLATRVERVEWDAEEFAGELRDQVGRKVVVTERPTHRDGSRLFSEDDAAEVQFADDMYFDVNGLALE